MQLEPIDCIVLIREATARLERDFNGTDWEYHAHYIIELANHMLIMSGLEKDEDPECPQQ